MLIPRKLILIGISCLTLNTSGQAPLLTRQHEFIRVDPRGARPSNLNEPLSFFAHAFQPCVNDKKEFVEYFKWEDGNGWIPEQFVIRDSTEEHALHEFKKFNDGPLQFAESDLIFDASGHLLESRIKNTDASGGVSLLQRSCKYQGGFLVTDENKVDGKATNCMNNILSFDNKGSVTNIVSERKQGPEGGNTVIYDLSYVDDRLASIVQSSLSEATGRTFPVFRYDEFKHGNDHLRFSGFRTGIFIGDEWITFRRDSITVLNDRLIRWDGISTEAGKPSSVQSCRLLLDKNGNLTDLLQYTASDEIASLELIGHLHFEIEYEADGISPAKVTTSYMKPDKTYGYSLKLVYSDRKPSDNGKSLTIFPNPANDHCAIYLSGNSVINGTITATDSQGRTMFSMQGISIESRGFTFDTSTFPPGTYQVQVVDNGFQSVGKFVVVR